MKKIICILIIFSLLFLVSCGAKTPATPTEAVTTATTVAEATTAARTEAGNILVEGDHSPDEPLSDALLHEIEEYFKSTPDNIPLYQYGEYGEKHGMMIPYYGTYDGYVIFAVEGALYVATVLRIAGEIFYHHQIMTFFAYKDGEITKLEDLYAAGKISDEAIKKIAEYHREFNDIEEYYAKKTPGWVDEDNYGHAFSDKIIQGIKDAWKDEDHAPEHIVPLTISGDTYVFELDRSLKYYTDKTFGDFVFRGYTPGYIFAYRNGEVMTLDEAFDNGYIGKNDLSTTMILHADWLYSHKITKYA